MFGEPSILSSLMKTTLRILKSIPIEIPLIYELVKDWMSEVAPKNRATKSALKNISKEIIKPVIVAHNTESVKTTFAFPFHSFQYNNRLE